MDSMEHLGGNEGRKAHGMMRHLGRMNLVLPILAALSSGPALAEPNAAKESPAAGMFVWPDDEPAVREKKETPPVRRNPIAPLTVEMIPEAPQPAQEKTVEAPAPKDPILEKLAGLRRQIKDIGNKQEAKDPVMSKALRFVFANEKYISNGGKALGNMLTSLIDADKIRSAVHNPDSSQFTKLLLGAVDEVEKKQESFDPISLETKLTYIQDIINTIRSLYADPIQLSFEMAKQAHLFDHLFYSLTGYVDLFGKAVGSLEDPNKEEFGKTVNRLKLFFATHYKAIAEAAKDEKNKSNPIAQFFAHISDILQNLPNKEGETLASKLKQPIDLARALDFAQNKTLWEKGELFAADQALKSQSILEAISKLPSDKVQTLASAGLLLKTLQQKNGSLLNAEKLRLFLTDAGVDKGQVKVALEDLSAVLDVFATAALKNNGNGR